MKVKVSTIQRLLNKSLTNETFITPSINTRDIESGCLIIKWNNGSPIIGYFIIEISNDDKNFYEIPETKLNIASIEGNHKLDLSFIEDEYTRLKFVNISGCFNIDISVDITYKKIDVNERTSAPVDAPDFSRNNIIERIEYVPVEVEKIVTVEKILEKPIEKIVEVPVEKIIEKVIEVPVEKIIEKVIEVPVEKIVEVPVEKISTVTKIVFKKYIPKPFLFLFFGQTALIILLLILLVEKGITYVK